MDNKILIASDHAGFVLKQKLIEQMPKETFENLKEAPLHKSHSKYGFLEPIKNYTPGIGISEIIEIPKTFDPNFKNDYFIL